MSVEKKASIANINRDNKDKGEKEEVINWDNSNIYQLQIPFIKIYRVSQKHLFIFV